MQTIGILLPRSTYYKTIGFDIFDGLKANLHFQQRNDIKIVSENIGFGTDNQKTYSCAEKLLLDDNVALVIAYIGYKTAELLKPLFLAANKMLVILDAGASLPKEWIKCPNLFYISLHNSLGAWLSAKKAVQDGYLKAGMISGYYDGGYLHTHGLYKGFEDAGGTISFNHSTGYKLEDFTMEPLTKYLIDHPDSALLSLFSGDFVQWYFTELEKNLTRKNIAIYLSPFGFEENMLEDALYVSDSIRGIAAWTKKINSEENKIFIEAMEIKGRKPNLFSLLGWESAFVALKILELNKETTNNVNEIANGLYQFEFESPRGKVFFDTDTNISISPLFEVEIIDNNGKCELNLIKEVKEVTSEFEKLKELPVDNFSSAWKNSYTCI